MCKPMCPCARPRPMCMFYLLELNFKLTYHYFMLTDSLLVCLSGSFYGHGGWDLVTGWFSDACDRENWRLLEDMLRLFKESPVTVERLKTNHCPKQVKHLSKEAQCEGELMHAARRTVSASAGVFVSLGRPTLVLPKCII